MMYLRHEIHLLYRNTGFDSYMHVGIYGKVIIQMREAASKSKLAVNSPRGQKCQVQLAKSGEQSKTPQDPKLCLEDHV